MSSLQELVESASKKYQQLFGSKPIFGGHGSGRVNLIGEHTDYNDGLVLPMALPLHTVVVGGVSKDGNCCIETMAPVDGTARACFSFDGLPPKSNPGVDAEELWSLYMKGVIANFPGREELKPFNAVVASTVPLGSGLSSSAALEVATFYFLDSILGGKTTTGLDPADKAKVCQKSEHDWVGVPCGLMDQLVSVAGKQNHALLIDCRTNSIEYVPLPSDEYVFAVTNSNVKHEHSNNEYANRKRSCEQVASLLGKSSLRDISMRELESSQNVLSQDLYRIARHVITENERTFNAADALKRNDLTVFGTLMIQVSFL